MKQNMVRSRPMSPVVAHGKASQELTNDVRRAGQAGAPFGPIRLVVIPSAERDLGAPIRAGARKARICIAN